MKKVLVLLMISLIASAASAATSLTWVDSEGADITSVDVNLSGTVTVYLSADNNAAYDTKWVGVDYVSGTSAAELTGISMVSGRAGQDGSGSMSSYVGWATVEAADLSEPFDSIIAGIQWAVTITGRNNGSIDMDSDIYEQGDGVNDILTVNVPEPMTMILLGLGGLLLKRRK